MKKSLLMLTALFVFGACSAVEEEDSKHMALAFTESVADKVLLIDGEPEYFSDGHNLWGKVTGGEEVWEFYRTEVLSATKALYELVVMEKDVMTTAIVTNETEMVVEISGSTVTVTSPEGVEVGKYTMRDITMEDWETFFVGYADNVLYDELYDDDDTKNFLDLIKNHSFKEKTVWAPYSFTISASGRAMKYKHFRALMDPHYYDLVLYDVKHTAEAGATPESYRAKYHVAEPSEDQWKRVEFTYEVKENEIVYVHKNIIW